MFQICFLCLLSLLSLIFHTHLVSAKDKPSDPDDPNDFFHYYSRPDIQAPKWNITVYDESRLAPGYWFVSLYASLKQDEHDEKWVGPFIYDTAGELVWSGAPFFDGYNCFDFRAAYIGEEEKLTIMYKREYAGMILDDTYHVEKVVDWPGTSKNDNMHDFTVYNDGQRALVLTQYVHPVSKERSQAIGFDGECLVESNGMMDLDITTTPPTIVFDWNATNWIGLDETTYNPPDEPLEERCKSGWDLHHFNSIDSFPDGDYLISSRYTDTLYKISHLNGSIVWRLGGIKSDWHFTGDSAFSRQHHARVREQNETHTIISLFDNARAPGGQEPTSDFSRGLILSLHDGRVEALHSLAHPHHQYSQSRGSTQFLSNGNTFMGWTFFSLISEHTGDGTLLMEAEILAKKSTYRSYKFPWVGRPTDPPDLFAKAAKRGNEMVMYASWNGATEVASWNIYETSMDGSEEKLIASATRRGFETGMQYSAFAPYVYAEALSSTGHVLGRSKVVESIPWSATDEDFISEVDWLETHVPADVGSKAPSVEGQVYDSETDNKAINNGYPNSLTQAAVQKLSSPFAAYLFGFITCAVAAGVVMCVSRRRDNGEGRGLWWGGRGRRSTPWYHRGGFYDRLSAGGGEEEEEEGGRFSLDHKMMEAEEEEEEKDDGESFSSSSPSSSSSPAGGWVEEKEKKKKKTEWGKL